MKKPLLIVLATAAVAALLATRKKVSQAEAEAELWAEATDPVTD